MAYKAGDRLCGCTLKQKCGEGAYGEVWLAEDPVGARLALKIIRVSGRYSERELAGLRYYKDCNHPNLLKIRHVEIDDDRICCTMDAADDLNHGRGEYLPDTLANRLRKSGRLERGEITALLEGLLAGLEELHRHGLVHRDIKPDNILWVSGRPTLADAGLIAPEGKGSFVGTPGFMSPKLLSGKGSADASDDFYALGKVVYCALTGLPVGEYPSIPENMTISAGGGLNRVLRESCSRPVSSAAEFRKLMTEEKKPGPGRSLLRRWLFLLPVVLLPAAAGILLRPTSPRGEKKESSAPLPKSEAVPPAPQQTPPADPMALLRKAETVLQTLEKADSSAQKDLQKRVTAWFRKRGLLPGDGGMTATLLNYEVMPQKEFHHRLWNTVNDPRLQPGAPMRYYPPSKGTKTPSALESDLFRIVEVAIGYPDFDPKQVKERQDFWRSQTGTPAELQRKMLESDPLMQAVALDSVFRDTVNTILRNGKMSEKEKAELEELLRLRLELLDPARSSAEFIRKHIIGGKIL